MRVSRPPPAGGGAKCRTQVGEAGQAPQRARPVQIGASGVTPRARSSLPIACRRANRGIDAVMLDQPGEGARAMSPQPMMSTIVAPSHFISHAAMSHRSPSSPAATSSRSSPATPSCVPRWRPASICPTAAATAPAAPARAGSCPARSIAALFRLAQAHRRGNLAQGYALFCCATAAVGSGAGVPRSRRHEATSPCEHAAHPRAEAERVAPDVIVLSLKLPASERLQYLAGQYIDFLLRDGKRRSFSIANAPHDDEFITLHVRGCRAAISPAMSSAR
jgi:hypothetical protein